MTTLVVFWRIVITGYPPWALIYFLPRALQTFVYLTFTITLRGRFQCDLHLKIRVKQREVKSHV